MIKTPITGGRGVIAGHFTAEEWTKRIPELAEQQEQWKLEASLRVEDGGLVFEFKNTGDKPKALCLQHGRLDLYYQFYFDVVFPDGHRSAYDLYHTTQLVLPPKPKPEEDGFFELGPGKTREFKVARWLPPDPEAPEPGEYRLAIRYVNYDYTGEEFGHDAWLGLLETEPVKLTLPVSDNPGEGASPDDEVGRRIKEILERVEAAEKKAYEDVGLTVEEVQALLEKQAQAQKREEREALEKARAAFEETIEETIDELASPSRVT